MLAKSERCDSLPSGVASPSGPLGAPHSSASGAEDGRGCDDESGDPTYAPVPRKASLSSGDSESAPEHAHCLSASGSGFSDAAHLGARVCSPPPPVAPAACFRWTLRPRSSCIVSAALTVALDPASLLQRASLCGRQRILL